MCAHEKMGWVSSENVGDRNTAYHSAISRLTESIMWCGMILKAINPESNPYPTSKDPSSQKVEPTADGLKL